MSIEANRRRIEDTASKLDKRAPKPKQSDSILMSSPGRGWVETCPVFAGGWLFAGNGEIIVVTR